MSADGYIAGPNGELDWKFVDDEFEEYINEMLRSIDGMIFGRVLDEFRLFVEPALLGGGKRLFDGSHAPIDLKLRQARPFRSGAVALFYDASAPFHSSGAGRDEVTEKQCS